MTSEYDENTILPLQDSIEFFVKGKNIISLL